MLCDLHLHTSKSDGVLAPSALFDEIRRRELELFCVTDHDCVDAYPIPDDLRPRAICGLEVDSHHDGHTVHILAYGIEDRRSRLLQTLEVQRRERRKRMAGMLERLSALGIQLTIEDVISHAPGASSLGRPHLARALVAKGHALSVQDAFDRYIADDGTGYVPLERLSSGTIIELVHEGGGLAVAAHPLRLHNPDNLNDLIKLGIDGIEVIHPTASRSDEHELRTIAKSHGLIVTGGTDFHAPVSERPLGVELDVTAVRALQERLAVNA